MENTRTEEFKVKGEEVVARVKQLVHEGTIELAACCELSPNCQVGG